MKLEEFIRMAITQPRMEDVKNSKIYSVVEATYACPLFDYKDFLKLTFDEKAELIRWGDSQTSSTFFENEERAMWFYNNIFLSQSRNNDDHYVNNLALGDCVCCTAIFVEKIDITDLSKRTTIIKSVSKPLPDDVIEKALERCYVGL